MLEDNEILKVRRCPLGLEFIMLVSIDGRSFGRGIIFHQRSFTHSPVPAAETLRKIIQSLRNALEAYARGETISVEG